MQRKQLVKKNGKWVEAYVDCGPTHPNTATSRPLPNRKMNGKRHTGRQT